MSFRWLGTAFLVAIPIGSAAQSNQPYDPLVPAGHSMHGEAFNEGPRQKAELMKGIGKVSFPISTRNTRAQKFFNQGVAQLHGFWYFEAERSFREAALLDPDSAMAYWGMSMANTQNSRRARGLIKEAVAREAKASSHERMWIDSLSKYYMEDKRDERTRKKEYAADLEAIVNKFPEDIEAKAFYGLQLWENGVDSDQTRQKVEKILNEVLAVEPMHPCHHYRIHLWNYNKDENALNSAARCGQAVPAIAHMWHMPGHTYSQLKQYDQAAWQQEASARVDHAQMMRYHVLPDQIHNYAHNNEWLIRDLSFIGRARDAVDLAKNMIELPRHPVYNHMDKWGSAKYGRHRLIETLIRYELWDEAIALAGTAYLEPTSKPDMQAARLQLLGLAYFNTGDTSKGDRTIAELESLAASLEVKQKEAADKAEDETRKASKPEDEIKKARETAARGFSADLDAVKSDLNELHAYRALAEGRTEEAKMLFAAVRGISRDRLSRIELAEGQKDEAEKDARQAAADGRNEVQPLANLVYILQQCGKQAESEERFQELRRLAAHADLDTPVMQRLETLARSLNLSADWRLAPEPRTDVGSRPSLDELGPFRWQPTPAAQWSLQDAGGRRISLKDYRGRPVLVVFFLGHGCVHCMAQLNLFAPALKSFKEAGIDVVAVSTDSAEGLRKTLMAGGGSSPFPFPIVSDRKLEVFKNYRCYDDFERTPLHGTFLVDGKGLVRWQDISYQPYTEVDFLLAESKRLLSQEIRTIDSRRVKSTRTDKKPIGDVKAAY